MDSADVSLILASSLERIGNAGRMPPHGCMNTPNAAKVAPLLTEHTNLHVLAACHPAWTEWRRLIGHLSTLDPIPCRQPLRRCDTTTTHGRPRNWTRVRQPKASASGLGWSRQDVGGNPLYHKGDRSQVSSGTGTLLARRCQATELPP